MMITGLARARMVGALAALAFAALPYQYDDLAAEAVHRPDPPLRPAQAPDCEAAMLAAPASNQALRYKVPGAPMLLTRTLRRELGAGETLTVRRGWRLMFSPRQWGYLVTGKQVTHQVDGPPMLEALADLERKRGAGRGFAICLDENGLIIAPSAGAPPSDAPATNSQLAERARLALKAAAYGREKNSEAMAHLRQMIDYSAGHPARLPADFFFPRQLAWQHGGQGGGAEDSASLLVTFTAERDNTSQLLHRSQRIVDAQMAGQPRRIYEEWELVPFPEHAEDGLLTTGRHGLHTVKERSN